MAAAADPNAKLYYNDYNLEYGTAKHAGALRIVKLVQSWGVKIDGVGLQGHLVSEPTNTASSVTPSVQVLTKVLQDYADLNVDVAYTELDIRSKNPSSSQKLSDAAAAWARVAQSCMNVQRCVGMTIWVSSFYFPFNQGTNITVIICLLDVLRALLTSTLGFPVPLTAKVRHCCGMITSRRSLLTRLSWTC